MLFICAYFRRQGLTYQRGEKYDKPTKQIKKLAAKSRRIHYEK